MIDSAVGWLKGCCSIETRHNKLAVNFMAMLKLTFLRQYLRVLRLSDRT
jgi:transposase